MATIRSILSITASEQMHLAQFNLSTAFSYGELEEVIYMQQPDGYDDGTDQVHMSTSEKFVWLETGSKMLVQTFWKVSHQSGLQS